MNLYFRELTAEDLPTILDISKDIWEGDDYVPNVIERWLREKNSMVYGAFLDESRKELIGFGSVKIFPNGVAWLEGGRVKISHQKQGIGRDLMKYAIDYAIQVGAKIAQYDTSSMNFGSLALAKYFGFSEKKRMEVLFCKANDVKLTNKPIPSVYRINLKGAKEIYKKIGIGPGDEVCIGWSYVPIQYLLEKNSSWIIKDNAIMQLIRITSSPVQEGPDENSLWMITYGDGNAAFNLIQYAISNETKNQKIEDFDVFCSPEVAKMIQEIGFSYWEDEPNGVVLVEKELT
jgi:GNAT superfamily N-acetyltransferase